MLTIFVTSSSESAISTLLQKLSSEYALTDLRDLHFLGIEVKRTARECDSIN
jgi:Na+/H+-dicarboxylate symporter